MAEDTEGNRNRKEATSEEQSRLIYEKCHACAKGNFCMIDRDQRLLCAGPKK